MSTAKTNYDLAWKIAINEYFEDFIFFFLPSFHEDMDWTEEPPQYINRKLTKFGEPPDAEPDSDSVYQLYRARFFDQEISPSLLHIQLQNQYDVNFESQMYICFVRAYDLQFRGVDINTVISIAILGDDNPDWRPDKYEYSVAGYGTSLTFGIIKIIDYESRWDELESSNNPFAIIVMAHLRTLSTDGNLAERANWKWRITQKLFERNFTNEQILKLFKIINFLMVLPNELQSELVAKVNRLEVENNISLID